jgi:hypothetical protein
MKLLAGLTPKFYGTLCDSLLYVSRHKKKCERVVNIACVSTNAGAVRLAC